MEKDKIIIAGKEFEIDIKPLPPYLLAEREIAIKDYDYSATWEIKDNFLYLIGFSGNIEGKTITLDDIFPNNTAVKAN